MEHGFLEILQGNAVPNGLVINAIGPAQKLRVGATEPALTIAPTFFASGILAMIVGFLVVIWAVAFVHKKYGAIALLLLSIVPLSGRRRLSTAIPGSYSQCARCPRHPCLEQ